MSRNFIFSEGEFYHCYGRGTEKRKIFLEKKDYQRFLHLLFVCNSKKTIHLSDLNDKKFEEIFFIKRDDTLVDIGAYALMTNHFHILLREKQKGGISLFMQKVLTAYTMYFNKKYQRTGSLFESKFKAKHATTDKYLKYIFSYIHLNCVKIFDSTWREKGIKNMKQVKDFLSTYTYSSYLDYLEGKMEQGSILHIKAFPDYFQNKKIFEEEIFDWLDYDEEVHVKVEP